MNERTILTIRLLGTHIFIIVLLIVVNPLVKGDFFMSALIIQTFLLIVYLAGYWEFLGQGFKILFGLLSEGFLLAGIYWKYIYGTWQTPSIVLLSALTVIELYLIFQLVKIFIVIFKKDPGAREIYFPLRNGKYLVTDGGNSKISRLMNYHYYSPVHRKKKTNRSMSFATDIVKLPDGRPLYMPSRNEDYPVFNERLYAPMNGRIVKVIDGIEDNRPFSGGYPYNTGNTVVIQEENYYFLLGHMKKGSITVREGDRVKAGNPVGAAGNSGMSERPHLHMQLMYSQTGNYWQGSGIALTFSGKNLFKNRLIYL